MSRAIACAVLVVACVVPAAAAAPPRAGTLVPGRSLGGVHLDESAAGVRAALGRDYGVCQGCARTTWYFTYRRFDQHGLAVELTQGRVSAVYTLWQPEHWHAPHGLQLGAPQAQVTELVPATMPVACTGYDALVTIRGSTRTVYYVVDGKLWGFGLVKTTEAPCR